MFPSMELTTNALTPSDRPQIPNGTAAIKALLKNLSADFKYEPGLVVADGDYVAIHGRYLAGVPSL